MSIAEILLTASSSRSPRTRQRRRHALLKCYDDKQTVQDPHIRSCRTPWSHCIVHLRSSCRRRFQLHCQLVFISDDIPAHTHLDRVGEDTSHGERSVAISFHDSLGCHWRLSGWKLCTFDSRAQSLACTDAIHSSCSSCPLCDLRVVRAARIYLTG